MGVGAGEVGPGISGVSTGGGGGSGTVTSVSVTPTNTMSGTVANATTTPAISLTQKYPSVDTNVSGGTPVSVSGAVTIDCNNGSIFYLKMTADVTSLTINNQSKVPGGVVLVYWLQDGTGGHSSTWSPAPSGAKWENKQALPSLSQAANSLDIMSYTLAPDTTSIIAHIVDLNVG